MNEFEKYMAGLRTRVETNEGIARQTFPERETRPQAARETAPDYFQRSQEREGRSNWSGGSMGGGTFAGRSR